MTSMAILTFSSGRAEIYRERGLIAHSAFEPKLGHHYDVVIVDFMPFTLTEREVAALEHWRSCINPGGHFLACSGHLWPWEPVRGHR